MGAGERDCRITLRRKTVQRDAYNTNVGVWVDLGKRWAKCQDVRDAERVQAQQVGASITSRFVIPWCAVMATLDGRDQLVDDVGLTYQISGVKRIGRRRELEITAAALADRAAR